MPSDDLHAVKRREAVRGTRCKRHGLVLNKDGVCRLCVVERRSVVRARLAAFAAAALVVTGATVYFQPRLMAPVPVSKTKADEGPSRQAAVDARFRPKADGSNSLASEERAPVANVDIAVEVDAASDEPVSVEDAALGEASPSLSARTSPPPAPPRAPVDPKPAAADDPRDFDLR